MGNKQKHLSPRESVTSVPGRKRSMMSVGGKSERDDLLIYCNPAFTRADPVVWESCNLFDQPNMKWQIAPVGRERAHSLR